MDACAGLVSLLLQLITSAAVLLLLLRLSVALLLPRPCGVPSHSNR